MRMDDRFINPLGFQVLRYRRDAETTGLRCRWGRCFSSAKSPQRPDDPGRSIQPLLLAAPCAAPIRLFPNPHWPALSSAYRHAPVPRAPAFASRLSQPDYP